MRAVHRSRTPRPPRKSHSTRRAAVEQRHSIFAAAFIANGGNATDAARAAGYRSSGTKVLEQHPELMELIERLRREAAEKAGVTAQQTLQDYKDSREFDPRDVYAEDRTFKHPKDLTVAQARQLESVETEEVFRVEGKGKDKRKTLFAVRVVKIKFAKRLVVTDMGMRHHGLYKENPSANKGPDELAAAIRAKLAMMESTTSGGKA